MFIIKDVHASSLRVATTYIPSRIHVSSMNRPTRICYCKPGGVKHWQFMCSVNIHLSHDHTRQEINLMQSR